MDGNINMDETARIVREKHGIAAVVEMTGGNVYTIYAGAADVDGRYAALAGPGYLNDANVPTGHAIEFVVGPDDDGETATRTMAELNARSEADVAQLIARTVVGENVNI